MDLYSFIDFGQKDFLRDENGEVIRLEFPDGQCASEWLIDHGDEYGWTNQGSRCFNWTEECDINF